MGCASFEWACERQKKGWNPRFLLEQSAAVMAKGNWPFAKLHSVAHGELRARVDLLQPESAQDTQVLDTATKLAVQSLEAQKKN